VVRINLLPFDVAKLFEFRRSVGQRSNGDSQAGGVQEKALESATLDPSFAG
jgi:hypothetical protein